MKTHTLSSRSLHASLKEGEDILAGAQHSLSVLAAWVAAAVSEFQAVMVRDRSVSILHRKGYTDGGGALRGAQ